ncbi:hypothetical protein F5883DRAFT_537632 [Diaporthe sp. PMI_573]|nr:hypothetical protein F5883DRAFT_537632 [Diaporthaceae sp. PMI_573]
MHLPRHPPLQAKPPRPRSRRRLVGRETLKERRALAVLGARVPLLAPVVGLLPVGQHKVPGVRGGDGLPVDVRRALFIHGRQHVRRHREEPLPARLPLEVRVRAVHHALQGLRRRGQLVVAREPRVPGPPGLRGLRLELLQLVLRQPSFRLGEVLALEDTDLLAVALAPLAPHRATVVDAVHVHEGTPEARNGWLRDRGLAPPEEGLVGLELVGGGGWGGGTGRRGCHLG